MGDEIVTGDNLVGIVTGGDGDVKVFGIFDGNQAQGATGADGSVVVFFEDSVDQGDRFIDIEGFFTNEIDATFDVGIGKDDQTGDFGEVIENFADRGILEIQKDFVVSGRSDIGIGGGLGERRGQG
jgi:hypothetical protein